MSRKIVIMAAENGGFIISDVRPQKTAREIVEEARKFAPELKHFSIAQTQGNEPEESVVIATSVDDATRMIRDKLLELQG